MLKTVVSDSPKYFDLFNWFCRCCLQNFL